MSTPRRFNWSKVILGVLCVSVIILATQMEGWG